MIIVFIVIAVTVISIIIQLASHRKDKYQRVFRSVFYRTQEQGKGAWGLGPWYYGAWDVGEKLNNEISAGKRDYSRKSRRHTHRHR
ncbi:MAG: hypothetical protein M3Y76_01740 [Chloroflexota bacterium]|nr:hypothetical protein [Chloroflexota bacterium]